ncbi:hypothetical protein [Streptomyces cavernae]|uniref:hypothetical protein n=1 Tax=Streptomyces cavernae TaxID=2259034 RepID=UPI0013918A24|nr:hypothetical protein [Streptomyces cavernae]
MDRDKWLVGLQFHTAGHQPVWLYYVVDEAVDTDHAVRTAIQRASGDPDRVVRGDVQAVADRIEVQRILRNAIGQVSLTMCL